MSFNKINCEEDRNLVLNRLKTIFDLKDGGTNFKEAEKLMDLLDRYDTLESSRSSFSDSMDTQKNKNK